MKTKNEEKMNNLAEQAVKTESIVGGGLKGASETPTPRPDPEIINGRIRQRKEVQEPLGSVEASRSRPSQQAPTSSTYIPHDRD